MIAWVVNKNDDWRTLVFTNKRPEKITKSFLSLPAAKDGIYKIQCVDPWSGKVLHESFQDSTNNRLDISLPGAVNYFV
jgi:hypothetical protein